MKIEEYYTVECNRYELHIKINMLSAKGPLAIIWKNMGSTRIISREKIYNALHTLEDMSKHKGPDVHDPRVTFYWDDADLDVTPRR